MNRFPGKNKLLFSKWVREYQYLENLIFDKPIKTIYEAPEVTLNNVYLNEDLKIVIKEKKGNPYVDFCSECMRREYEVGVLANSLPYLVKTMGYLEMESDPPSHTASKLKLTTSYLILEYIEGKDLTSKKDKTLYRRVLDIIREIQSITDFTHYDLHLNNIIITPKNEIRIIDLGRSYIKGLPPMFCQIEAFGTAVCPGVYDPIIDYSFFLSWVIPAESLQGVKPRGTKSLQDLFRLNNIAISDQDTPAGESGEIAFLTFPGLPMMKAIFLVGDFVGDSILWATNLANSLTMEEVSQIYSEKKYQFMIDNNVDISEFGEEFEEELAEGNVKEEQRIMYIANNYFNNKLNSLRDEYLLKFGRSTVHDKIVSMSKYVNTPEDFYNIGMKLINEINFENLYPSTDIEMSYTTTVKKINKDTILYMIKRNERILSWNDVIILFQDKKFVDFLIGTLCASEFPSYFWETSPVEPQEDFQFVLINAPGLMKPADKRQFEEHFIRVPEGSIVVFPNLSKDSLLIVPTPIKHEEEVYSHIAKFICEGDMQQARELFKVIGEQIGNLLNKWPKIYLSTHGLGVPWVHVRLDKNPKYYSFKPFKTM